MLSRASKCCFYVKNCSVESYVSKSFIKRALHAAQLVRKDVIQILLSAYSKEGV